MAETNKDKLEALRTEQKQPTPGIDQYHEQVLEKVKPASELDRILNQLDPDPEVEAVDVEPKLSGETPPPAEPQPAKPEQAQDPDLERHIHMLRLDGVPKGVIEKMSPQEIIEYADKRAEIIRTNDERMRRLKELEATRQTEELKPQASRAEPIAEAEIDLASITKGYGEEYGEDAARALAGILKPLMATIKGYEGQVNQTRDAVRTLLVEDARRQLVDEFPQLKDPAKFAEVEKKAGQIGGEGYPSVAAVLRDAATLVFADELRNRVTETKVDAEIQRRHEQRAAGQPSPPTRAEVPNQVTLTPEQRDDAVLAALDQGKTIDEVRAMLG